MKNKVFGEVDFNSGWETSQEIQFNGREYKVTVTADAYFEKDGITEEQEVSYASFLSKQSEILRNIENKLNSQRYIPSLLIFKRNGDYGLVFDDNSDIEGGIVVTISPEMDILHVDQYL